LRPVRLRTSEIAQVVGGEHVGPDVEIVGATIDSRLVEGGELFVPVIGARDGHAFVDDAVAAGASAYLIEPGRRPVVGGATAIVVPDPAEALAVLGVHARDRLGERVVGITGSVGKTTTKDLAAAALARRHRTYASPRSFNNELGVPLTLVNAPEGTEVAVVEMGARGPGHIAALCLVARPNIGVVTAVERVHTELFGDLPQVAEAKRELIRHLDASGTAVLNADDPLVAPMAGHTEASVLTFGLEAGDVRASEVRVDPDLRPRFRLRSPWGTEEVHLGVRGLHNVANALAAASVALVCDVDLAGVAEGLAAATVSPWRMDLRRTDGGALVLNDAYNAGPASTIAALQALAHLDADRRIAVLGPMAELGEHHHEEHVRVAGLADDLGIRVLAVGAPDYGTETVEGIDAAVEALGPLGVGDAVLVKGSRVAGLERLVERLVATPSAR
jgi:UDP-N-acetylmuramoyl-tripeptide--D-alanyl-D-alanine ligase